MLRVAQALLIATVRARPQNAGSKPRLGARMAEPRKAQGLRVSAFALPSTIRNPRLPAAAEGKDMTDLVEVLARAMMTADWNASGEGRPEDSKIKHYYLMTRAALAAVEAAGYRVVPVEPYVCKSCGQWHGGMTKICPNRPKVTP